jgi:hypothetical protein
VTRLELLILRCHPQFVDDTNFIISSVYIHYLKRTSIALHLYLHLTNTQGQIMSFLSHFGSFYI